MDLTNVQVKYFEMHYLILMHLLLEVFYWKYIHSKFCNIDI